MMRSLAPAAVRQAYAGAFKDRFVSDLSISRTGNPVKRIVGGRSSLGGEGHILYRSYLILKRLTGHNVTVFGATGQLGRYVVNRLARRGCTVVVPFREEMAKRHLKVAGDLGKVVFIEFDLRNTASIEACVRHADTVYNLIGRNYPTKNFSLDDVHVEGTDRITEAVKKYDVDRYIHVSSYNANPASKSEFFSSKSMKGRGEQVARSNLPQSTLVRPAPIFGFEDNLLLKLASSILFTANHMREKFWPVHSIDVGEALEKMLDDDSTAGQTFELFGPRMYTMAQIKSMVDRETFTKKRHVNVPKAILRPLAQVLNRVLWWHTLSADEVEREFIDQVIDATAKTFKDLGVHPGDISSFTYHYLQGFRSSNYYDLPPATEKEKKEEKKYIHVLNEL
ncbi:hypothetical protein CDD80_7433 [Ophiocordyceps camponoti-rufipedis]|uniref:NAD-dependent epimerase/dehydratase domain-containing protein n=1 Tax=Ophiocordyceps camponoti-rufipedis TaxID=2004952 RepID=A0A2C5YLR0_9HYPO|nr:hypothetical protein CDD80_7433 [Ophiocordyceps camponoti-rufipedis]